jgi:hypothetical protein
MWVTKRSLTVLINLSMTQILVPCTCGATNHLVTRINVLAGFAQPLNCHAKVFIEANNLSPRKFFITICDNSKGITLQ